MTPDSPPLFSFALSTSKYEESARKEPPIQDSTLNKLDDLKRTLIMEYVFTYY